MIRTTLAHIALTAAVVGTAGVAPAHAQEPASFTGRWALNRQLSQFPREIGFGADWATAAARGADPTAGGGRGAGGAGTFGGLPESEDEARRKQQLTSEVRTPPERLVVVDAPDVITVEDDRGRSRTFHPDGRDETLQLDGVPVVVNARREAGRFVVLYKVQQGRELRYTYSRIQNPTQLVVDVQFVERGGGDRVRRVYEPASATDTMSTPTAAAPPATSPATNTAGSRPATTLPSDRQPAETFDQRPDAALRGIKTLGVVVEDLGSQAIACGLTQAGLEAMVSKRLSEAGFTVSRNTDEDTYVYVNIGTASLSTGVCVSRYDVSFITHTTARLSYSERSVLVEVLLLHKGGIAGTASAAHGAAVLRGVQEYLDAFVTRIRDANK